jgi:hypothetical protein
VSTIHGWLHAESPGKSCRSGFGFCGSVRARQGFVRFAHRCAALTRPPPSRGVAVAGANRSGAFNFRSRMIRTPGAALPQIHAGAPQRRSPERHSATRSTIAGSTTTISNLVVPDRRLACGVEPQRASYPVSRGSSHICVARRHGSRTGALTIQRLEPNAPGQGRRIRCTELHVNAPTRRERLGTPAAVAPANMVKLMAFRANGALKTDRRSPRVATLVRSIYQLGRPPS